MSIDKEKDNLLIYGKPTGTIEVKPHPEDILEVEPEVLALMQARLKGESFDEMYGAEDRVSKEFLIQKEKEKIQTVFTKPSDVLEAFSSLKSIKEIRQELQFAEIDRELLSLYSLKLSHGEPVDEVDAYMKLLDGQTIKSKRSRIADFTRIKSHFSNKPKCLFDAVLPFYQSEHFIPFLTTKEMLQLNSQLRIFLNEGSIAAEMDVVLKAFYMRSV